MCINIFLTISENELFTTNKLHYSSQGRIQRLKKGGGGAKIKGWDWGGGGGGRGGGGGGGGGIHIELGLVRHV